MPRVLIAGLAGGLTFNVVILLTFRWIGFGWNGGGFLLTSPIQSHKLIAVWTQIEPLPLVVVVQRYPRLPQDVQVAKDGPPADAAGLGQPLDVIARPRLEQADHFQQPVKSR